MANIITPIPNDLNKLSFNSIQPFVKAFQGFVPSMVTEHITNPMFTNATVDANNGITINTIKLNWKAMYRTAILNKTVVINSGGIIINDLI